MTRVPAVAPPLRLLRLLRSLPLAVLALACTACEGGTWTGPLRASADSLLPSLAAAACDTASIAFGFPVEQPTRTCKEVRGDTAFTVVSDAQGLILVLTRAITVDSTRQMILHDSLQFELGTRYDAPNICPDVDGAVERERRIWRSLDRQIELKSRGLTQLIVEVRADHPGCDGQGRVR